MGSLGPSCVGVVLVFDFDKTLIDCDSDDWVVEGLHLKEIFDQLRPSMGWNALMNRMMMEHHSRGKSIQEIAECLRKVSMDLHLISAIKSAYALGCDLRIVSDANTFFIETILEKHGVRDCFSEINTNPATVEDGRLKISPYLDSNTSPPHGCPLCPPNMCKGRIIERIRAEASKGMETCFIYLGDGRNDFCPSLKLTKDDHMMPRRNYPVWDLICKNSHLIQAEVHDWSHGDDQAGTLLRIINKVLCAGETSPELLPLDQEYSRAPLTPSTYEGLPKTLRVPA